MLHVLMGRNQWVRRMELMRVRGCSAECRSEKVS